MRTYAHEMLATDLNYGMPDVDLPWSCGGTVNPSCFAGHQLFVLFLPADRKRQAAELDSYDRLADQFAGTDAWFLVIAQPDAYSPGSRETPVAFDPNGTAWSAFRKLAKRKLRADRDQGAAFLFARGGALHRVWSGAGHSEEVLQELNERL